MNYKSCMYIILVIISFYSPAGMAKSDQEIEIIELSCSMVLDEWKAPGLYSPYNIFDSDQTTCYAVDENNKNVYYSNALFVDVEFEKPVYIDEVRLFNGNAKDQQTFLENNRIKDFVVFFKNYKINKSFEERFKLEDKYGFKSHKFSTPQVITGISFSNRYSAPPYGNEVYKGTKYNNACLSEMEFYYNGRKLKISNIQKLKDKYMYNLEKSIRKTFSDRNYMVVFRNTELEETPVALARYLFDGTINYSTPDNILNSSNISGEKAKDYSTYMPVMWKVNDSKLYMKFKGKWILYRYYIRQFRDNQPRVYLFTLPVKFFPEDGFLYLDNGLSNLDG